MESKLRSRKFWMVVATFVAGVIAVFTETDIDPQIVYGYIAALAAWLGIQGWTDKAEAASGISLERRLFAAQMQAMAAQLQGEAEAAAEANPVEEYPVPVAVMPTEYPPLTPVS
jgi:hypothetical protein